MYAFADTNVVVYAYDNRDPAKQQIARKILDDAAAGKVVISSQVVQEFCNTVVHRLKLLDPFAVIPTLEDVLMPMARHFPTPEFYVRAIRLYGGHSLSFYDVLIIQAALDLGCRTLYTEDMQAGQKFGSVTIVNPFV